jgi:hypothetical protein
MQSVGLGIDSKLSMSAHIEKSINDARVARVRLQRLRFFCSKKQLLALYKSFIWGKIEYACIAYNHASQSTLSTLDNFQDNCLRCLGLDGEQVLSLGYRRSFAFLTMIYKQVVLKMGPNTIRSQFAVDDDTPVRQTRSTARSHGHRLRLTIANSDLDCYRRLLNPFQQWNALPASIFPSPPSLEAFKKNLNMFMSNQ